MKKIVYTAPEMEVVKLALNNSVLLQTSQTEGPAINDNPGSDDPNDAG